ncbi:hypothetical protein [Arthrobacter sp. Soil782]|uniref:hypothetical protein n=1 Tax=Arthrobacter sp. Soil782 TaxID=1736410 RepID=UPI0012F888E3|nr:hypothetical protein [Arthrobacter sp. Soil782]
MTAQMIEQLQKVDSHDGTLWEVKVGTAAGQFLSMPRKAAERLAAIAERRLAQGRPIMFTVYRLNGDDKPDWDASARIAEIFAVTGWPASNCSIQRAQVIDILEAALTQEIHPFDGRM